MAGKDPTDVTRRQFAGAIAATGLAASLAPRAIAQAFETDPPLAPGSMATLAGVRMGVETYCFHDVPRNGDPAIIPMLTQYMHDVGINECEIMSAHIEQTTGLGNGWWVTAREQPTYPQEREAARQWRIATPPAYYEAIRERFRASGISIYSYNLNVNETFTDEERDHAFIAGRALGAEVLVASCTISEIPRSAPFAEKHGMILSPHNHNNIYDPDQFATPEGFERAFAVSPNVKATLDIGHFAAGNNDPVAFIEKHHDRIVVLHIRDRKRDNGPHVPLGQGDARVRDVLRLVRDAKLPIRCYVELEYGSLRPPVDEVKRALEFCKSSLV